jgi:NTE family protein
MDVTTRRRAMSSATTETGSAAASSSKEAAPTPPISKKFGQIVLVLQGGGALGAYQAGVYEAMHEAGIEPDWVVGTSIGAINAALIACNRPEDRLVRLREFWKRMEQSSALEAAASLPWIGNMLPNWATMAQGISGFFKPNPLAFLGTQIPLAPEAAGYYSTKPLEQTLGELTDFSLLEKGAPRLTVGAANVRTSEMCYFDSRESRLTAHHVMASGALPPAFPAVRIDGELYWDGGILSNTPVEVVFDDRRRRNSLVFAVHIWNPSGMEPSTIQQVMNRQKDIQYSSRAVSHIKRQRQLHKLRHIISELSARLPEDVRKEPDVRGMSAYGCKTLMHVVRLLAPNLEGEDHTKDIDFSAKGIGLRWQAGLMDTREALRQAPWEGEVEAHEGFVLHEMSRGVEVTDAK